MSAILARIRRLAQPRYSLRVLLVLVTIVCAALGWRALCLRQLERLTLTMESEKGPTAIAPLSPEAATVIEAHIPQDDIASVSVWDPDSRWEAETVAWGIGLVNFSATSQPSNIRRFDTDGGFADETIFVFQANARPWGLVNVRHSRDITVTKVIRLTSD